MNIQTKIATSLAIALMLLPLLSGSVHAGFGVSPAEIIRKHLKPGAHFEQEIVLSRSEANEDLKVTIEPDLEQMAEWFQFDPGPEVTFPAGQQRLPITVMVDVPPDAELDSFDGRIRFKASPAEQEEGGVTIVQGARVEVALVTTEIDITDLEVRQLKIADTFGDENIRLSMTITNNGNVATAPSKVQLTIQNLQQEDLETVEDTTIEAIPPNETKEVFAEFSSSQPPGEYFGNASVYLGNEVLRQERIVFTINEQVRTKDSEMAGSENSSEAFIARIQKFFSDNRTPLIYLAVASGTLSLIALVGLVVSGTLSSTATGLILLLAALVVGSLISLFVAATGDSTQTKETIEYEEIAPTEQPSPTPEPTATPEPSEATESGEVEGVSTEIEIQPEPLRVRSQDNLGAYIIYTRPDVSSDILQIANEGDTFSVIEENENWYKVSISADNSGGWILKSDIKAVNEQNSAE